MEPSEMSIIIAIILISFALPIAIALAIGLFAGACVGVANAHNGYDDLRKELRDQSLPPR
jgi:hypothetical protein